ncbi:ABC transporter ATP-binding protein [Marinobacter sp. CHS3-4]|uniref:ABC transporter ATP-binding protein n=1 Tax=Marinobacter sp. CHS3-4 TaxID=3045174 RepID=UPI0024B6295D|nr:ABC transporter ATP-binding protein [Marinobacter sp. CHS3-4]MDI9244314.1 ABC transporter ATP-binding protein [Marinobacter sp. CHS3-4]
MTNRTHQSDPTPDTEPQTLKLSGVAFQWDSSKAPLRYPDVTLQAGSHLFLQGPSGSGKSTLMSLLGGLITPSEGRLEVLGTSLASLSSGQRDRFRADHIGVIFQQFNLVPYLSPMDNVRLPCRLSRKRLQRAKPDATTEARSLLTALGIPEDSWHRSVLQLSVGQQQRVAAARALIGGPELILADEPTSALDTNNRDRFIALLLELAAKQRCSVVFVSHDQSLANQFDQQLHLQESTR